MVNFEVVSSSSFRIIKNYLAAADEAAADIDDSIMRNANASVSHKTVRRRSVKGGR